MAILFFLIIISLLVFVHEWGHFFAARRSGVAVEEFGFGFPPRLWSRRHGGTLWSINLIPFGGFVKLQGEQEDETRRSDSFVTAPHRKKFIILAAGVFMNYLLAWILLSGALTAGVTALADELPSDRWHRFTDASQRITVGPDSAAAKAGVQSGDQLVSVDGQPVRSTADLITYVQDRQYPELAITVVRDNRQQQLTVAAGQPVGGSPRYGLGIDTIGQLSYPWYVAPWYGLVMVVRLSSQTFAGLGQLLTTLISTGKLSADVTGPIGIAVLTNQVTQLGFVALIQFTAIISISLAVLNFLPIPALDGGRAVFVILEAIRKRPVNRRVEAIIHTTSFYALILFILLISIRDVSRFDIMNRVRNVFQ